MAQAAKAQNEVAVRENEAPIAPTNALTPMEMVEKAIASGSGVEVIEKLMTLQERYEKNQARKAFDNAMANAKAEIPVIVKNRTVGFESKRTGGSTSYQHEDMPQIARTVDPILTKHGLSYRYRTNVGEGGVIAVTCIVSHREGHAEETTLTAGRDDSGSKNNLQAVGSTITYLQRYTLKAALGLAAAGDDDAKASSGAEPITEAQATELRRLIDLYGAEESKIKAHAGKLAGVELAEIEDMPARVYDRVVVALTDWARKQRESK